MPDLPLDTLVILGLVLASLLGRIFQKKKEPASRPDDSSPDDSSPKEGSPLEEMLRRALGGDEQPEVVTEEFLSQDEEIEDLAEQVEVPAVPVPEEPPLPIPVQVSAQGEEKEPASKNFDWLQGELHASKYSLARAFVLKEVLDEPVSLRSSR